MSSYGNQWFTSSAAGDFYSHQIEQSLRFSANNSGTSSRLYRTYGTVSSQTAFTFSMWVKRAETYASGQNTVWQMLMSTGTALKVEELRLVLSLVVELLVD